MQSLELTPVIALETTDVLDQLNALPGVSFAALMDREGFVIGYEGRIARDAEAVTALASCLLESSEGIGRELGHGSPKCTICEFDEGLVFAMDAGASSRLVVVLRDHTSLDVVRRCASQALASLSCTP